MYWKVVEECGRKTLGHGREQCFEGLVWGVSNKEKVW